MGRIMTEQRQDHRLGPTPITEKHCNRCDTTKPVDQFGVQNKVNKLGVRTGDGYQSACFVCNAAYRDTNRERIRERHRGYYWENREDISVKNKARRADRSPEQVLKEREYHHSYYSENKEAMAPAYAKYRAEHREELRLGAAAWRADPKNAEKRAAMVEKMRVDYAERIAREGRGPLNEYRKKYYAENKAAFVEREQRRRVRKKGVNTDGHTVAELHAYWETLGIDPKHCSYCDKFYPKWESSMGDHVVALANGGKDFVENIVPCCVPCNSSKNDRVLYEEWTPPNMNE